MQTGIDNKQQTSNDKPRCHRSKIGKWLKKRKNQKKNLTTLLATFKRIRESCIALVFARLWNIYYEPSYATTTTTTTAMSTEWIGWIVKFVCVFYVYLFDIFAVCFVVHDCWATATPHPMTPWNIAYNSFSVKSIAFISIVRLSH